MYMLNSIDLLYSIICHNQIINAFNKIYTPICRYTIFSNIWKTNVEICERSGNNLLKLKINLSIGYIGS